MGTGGPVLPAFGRLHTRKRGTEHVQEYVSRKETFCVTNGPFLPLIPTQMVSQTVQKCDI